MFEGILNMLKALLRSRKFWISVVAVLVTIFQDVLGLDPAIVESIRNILMFLVGMIAVEDGAEKLASMKKPQS